ncbi:PepSY-associated TM helix domain-containing protein [Tardiphaga sp.]|uniref:PepSY-associated TM helix domain-containing protein n=1 Tax=Tardiphaga sp. TaxID=1926292 RepID=UPI00352A919B
MHRWTGLALAGFLTIVGLTGAILAWNDELERVFAPSMFVLGPESAAKPALDPFALRDAAARAVPGYAINGVDFTRKADQPAIFYVEAKQGGPAPRFDQIALDPASGRVMGRRRAGDLGGGPINVMPFIYSLHDQLALGPWGAFVLGIAALAWTLDCFVGAYLTLPARGVSRRRSYAWATKWAPAWAVRFKGGQYRLFYDLHRAGGLWPWLLMLVVAWSSVSFNLPQVYRPVTAAIFGSEPQPPRPRIADPAQPPRLGWQDGYREAQRAMKMWAAREGFVVRSERLLFYDPASHAYEYRVVSNRDPSNNGNTTLRLDGDSGRLVSTSLPTGRAAGTTLTSWIGDIHVGNVFGIAMKIALSLTGVAVATLSITGVWLWWRKRKSRRFARGRRRRVHGLKEPCSPTGSERARS